MCNQTEETAPSNQQMCPEIKKKIFSGAPNEKILAKHLLYHFLLFKIVSELLKGIFEENFRKQNPIRRISELLVALQKCWLTFFCPLNDIFVLSKTLGIDNSSCYESPR